MAKTAIAGGDLTILRGNQSIPDLSLFVTPLQSVVTGEITAIPSRYPTTQVTVSWDGATTDVSTGQMVRITNGSTIKAYAVVRKDISGSTLYISETPLGAYGYATMIESPILVGDTVTIYNHRPLWGMYSRIDAKTKTFYKMWDVAYSSQNEGNIPIANAGAWQAAKLVEGETTARFTLPRGGVNTSFVIDNVATPNIDWLLPDGVSLVAGYALDDYVIEVDAVVGSHLVGMICTIGSTEHTAYLWLFVSDGTNHLSATNAVSLPQSDSQSRLGREMSFTVYGDNLRDVIYPGAGFMLREWPHYDSGTLTDGVGIDSFIGYIADISFSHDGNIGSATFKVESPMIYAQRIAQPTQSLEEVSEATKWTECEFVLSNPCGFAYYLIRWHTPALLEMHDYDAEDYTTPRRKYLKCNSGRTLGANLAVVAGYLAGNIGSASDGTTVMRPNPLYMGQSARDAIATILTFQEQDIAAPLEYTRRQVNTYAEVRGGAFSWGGANKEKGYYVGRQWSQGSGSINMPECVVTPAEGLTRAKEIIGHFFAEQNAEIQEVPTPLTLNMDVLDPAYMLWAALTISATYDPYGLGFSSNRLLPNAIEREWSLENGNIRKLIKVRSQGETFGQAGVELPVGANVNMNGWSPGSPIIWQPNFSGGMFGGDQSLPVILTNNDEGDFAVCLNYMTANPEWYDLRSSVGGKVVNDFDFDYGSAFFASGRDASQALGVYVVTTDAFDAHIYYFADILRSNLAELIQTVTLNDGSVDSEARILCSEGYPLLVLAGFKDGTGTRYTRSTDGGASWGSLTRVGSAVSDRFDNDNAPLGMAVDGQRQLISAPNSSIEYGTYYASTAGGAFSKLTGSEDSAYPQQMIAIAPETTTAYVTSRDVIATSNDFDGADYWPYQSTPSSYPCWDNFVESADWTYNGIVAGGLTGNAPKWTGVNPQGEGVGVDRAGMTFYSPTYPSNSVFYGLSCKMYYTLSAGSQQLSVGLGGGSLTQRFAGAGIWHDVSFNLSNEGIFPLSASAIELRFSPRTDVTGTMTVWIDDLVIYLGDGAKLWKVTSFTTSPTWTDISPSAGEAPERPYDFAVDRLNPDVLNFVSGVGTDWRVSSNAGSSWSVFANNTPYRALYTQGSSIAAGGLLSVGLSLDSGGEFANIEGNLSSLWGGSVSTIKKVLAV